MKEKIMALMRKKHDLETKLVVPARAAANQMKDAGMARGADPLLEILFQLDAVDAEMTAFITGSNPAEFAEVLIGMMGGGEDKKK